MKHRKFAPIAIAIFALHSSAGWAADNELYDDPPPEDAAFIRWIEKGSAPPIFGVSAARAEGDVFHPVSVALTKGAREGRFYTAAFDAEGRVAILEEPARRDRSKVLLTLLNFSGDPVRLVLSEQDVAVIDNTAVNAAEGRLVNAVSTSLSVVSQSGVVLGSFEVQLRRGQNITFVARPGRAEVIENRFGSNIER